VTGYWRPVETTEVSGLWDSIVGWFQGTSATVMDQFEKYKAKLYTMIGNLLNLRETILNMQDQANNLVLQAQRTNNPVALAAARNLKQQVDAVYQEQLDTERKVQDATARVNQVDSATSAQGVGVLPIAVIAGAVAVLAAAVAAIVIHTQRVNYLHRALDDLEKKILTQQQYNAATGAAGSSPFDFLDQLGTIGKVALAGGVLYVGYKLIGRRRA